MATKKSNRHIIHWFFILASGITLLLFWRVVEPYILTLITAAIFGVLLSPLQSKCTRIIKSERLSALLMIIGVFLLVLLPLVGLAILLVGQATELMSFASQNDLTETVNGWLATLIEIAPDFAKEYIAQINVLSAMLALAEWLQSNLAQILAGGASFVLQLFIFFIALFNVLVHRKWIHQELLELSPFKDSLDDNIVRRMNRTVRGVMFGAIIIAFVQATVATIGLLIFGVPKALLWGSLVLIAAQVPLVGVGLIMVPAILYLFLTGDTGMAFGLLIWAVVFVGLVDNFLSPILVGKKTKMPELLVLVSILGGIELFGPIGFIVGPVILSGVLVMRDLYKSGILDK